jgi:hypothetical protein
MCANFHWVSGGAAHQDRARLHDDRPYRTLERTAPVAFMGSQELDHAAGDF